jgi:glycosyltransferase involved in cell wall biosynthesis
MKICILSDQYAVRLSGIGLYTKNLVDALLKKKYEVTLLCREPDPKKVGINYVRIPTGRFDPTHGKWYSIARNTNKMILDIHRKFRFDLFHSADARQGAMAAARLKRIGVPSVGNMNDYYFADSTKNPLYFLREYKVDGLKRFFYNHFTRSFEKRNLKNFDVLIANSNVTREKIIEAYHLDSRRVVKIYKALGNMPKKRKSVSRKGPFTVSLAGVNLQRKGVFYLIDAMPDIIREFPATTFEIMGKYDRKMVSECKRKGVLENVRFHGVSSPEKVEDLYMRTDVFILPSLIEGFGIVLLEAMSHGIPCIGTDTGGIKELIKNEETGIIIRPGSSKDISKALSSLMKDYRMREKISKGAFSFSKKFDMETLVRETEKIYRKLNGSALSE